MQTNLFGENGFTVFARQALPDFFSGKTQYRGDPASHRLGNVIHRRLRRASCLAVCLTGVLSVFDDIEIEAAKFGCTEVM